MMKKAGRLIAAALAVILALMLAGCADEPEKSDGYSVRVILRRCDGISISGKNIAEVEAGRTVTFRVSIDEGYIYIGNTAGAEYDEEDGRLRLKDVFAPTTVDMIVLPKSEVVYLEVKRNSDYGSVSESEMLLAGPSEVTLSAEGKSRIEFTGWSEGGYLDGGGTLISTDPVHTFYIDASKVIYANFAGSTDYSIVYHLDGGYVSETGEDTYISYAPFSDLYSMQQTMESNGKLVRDGYVAVGYSTSPANYEDYDSANDIPDFSNMGGVCVVDGDSLDLHVVWAKESPDSDFIYEKKEIEVITDSTFGFGRLNQRTEKKTGIEITGYVGKDELAVIPEKIDGQPVLSIASDAFGGDLERVVIPRTVKIIEKGAFSACENLREVVFFDSVVTVYDDSFNRNVSTVVLNAQRLPVYSGQIEGSFNVKYDRLRTVEGKKIVVVAGSSSLNGINSELFEELMPGYSVVNYGTNAANPSLFFLDVISKYCGEGDIIVHAPEYGGGAPMGTNEFHAKMFRGNEQCYDIFRNVDMSDYVGFWDCFREFQVGDTSDSSLTPAIHQSGKEYQLDAEINKYGDIGTVRKSVRGSFGGASESFVSAHLYGDNLNAVNEKITARGATLVMSFAPHDKSRIRPSELTQEAYDKVNAYCAETLDYPVISDVGEYIMEHSEFYDSEWHLNDEGAKKRTQHLADDLKAYLADPSSY